MADTSAIIQILRMLVPAVYLVGAIGYIMAFIGNRKHLSSWVRPVCVVGLTLHFAFFIALLIEKLYFPTSTLFEWLILCSLALSGLSFLIERLYRQITYGAFLWPLNTAMLSVSSLLLRHGNTLPEAMMSPYFAAHAVSFFLAYACFLLTFTVSTMYLLQYREIKSKHPGALFRRLPALEIMDRSVMHVDAVGLGFLLLGLVMGYLWLEYSAASPALVAAKAGFTVLTAAAYLSEHILRNGKGWKGRRTCVLSMIGFAMAILTLLVGKHGY